MRKHLTLVSALAVAVAVGLSAVAFAAREKPVVVKAGNVVLTFSTKVSPKALSRTQFTPISLSTSGSISTTDGSQPPALREVIVDAYKGAEVNVKGVPVCKKQKLEADTTKAAETACPGSILGRGTATVRVAFPESAPFDATGPLVYFNGGEKSGVTTIYVQAYVAVPAPTAIVSTVKFAKEHKGPYGLHVVATIPPIAGGSGSITKFAFSFPRTVSYAGYTHSYLLAKCATGTLYARLQAIFSNGTNITGNVIRPCEQKG